MARRSVYDLAKLATVEREGVASFAKSYTDLLATLESRAAAL